MVTAIVVMLVSAVIAVMTFIPYIFKFAHCSGLATVKSCKEVSVDRLTVVTAAA